MATAYNIKRLGVYTDVQDLNDAFKQLSNVLSSNGLIDGKPVFLKLAGETVPRKLLSDKRDLHLVPESELDNSLFLTDVITLITGVAKQLSGLKVTNQLSEFSTQTRDTFLLDQWKERAGENKVAPETYFRLLLFVQRLDTIFKLLLNNTQENNNSQNQTISGSNTATVPKIDTKKLKSSNTKGERSGEILIQNGQFIRAALDQFLIERLLSSNNVSVSDLPSHLQEKIEILRLTLTDEIRDFIGSLSNDEFFALSSSGGNLQLRILIFRKFIYFILSTPTNPLHILLTEVYKEYFEFIEGQQINFDKEKYFNELSDSFVQKYRLEQAYEDLEELAEIRQKIQEWKQQFLAQLAQGEAEQAEDETEKEDGEPEKKEEEQPEEPQKVDQEEPATQPEVIPSEPQPDEAAAQPPILTPFSETKVEEKIVVTATSSAAPQVLSSSQVENLRTHLTNTAPSLTTIQKEQIQVQSNKLLWGTLAELFRENDETITNAAHPIFKLVQTQALNYLLSLPPEELNKLRKSPSTLIRHIKNLRDRIQTNKDFSVLYQTYQTGHETPIVSRANRVEKETNWGYTQLTYELFSAHNITDATTPDESELKAKFTDLKYYLKEKVFLFFEQLHEQDLAQIYIRPSERKKILKQLHEYLSADPTFAEELSNFYANLLSHLEVHNPTQKEWVQNSLLKTTSKVGNAYRIKTDLHTNSTQLFTQVALASVNRDNPVLMKSVTSTLDSMIMTYGLEETQDLINKVDLNLLEITFGLPSGTLTPTNSVLFRSILHEYSTTRTAQFSSVAGSYEAGGMLGESAPAKDRPDYETADQSTVLKRMEPVKTVREVVQDAGGEEVAEATNKLSQKEKAKIFFKMYEKSWNSLTQEQQIVIYLYYDKPVNKQVFTDVRNNLPLPIEFIDFQALDRDGRKLDELVELYQNKKTTDFDQVRKDLQATESANIREHFIKVEQLRAALTLYYLQEMAIEEQEEIARMQGYESATQLVKALNTQRANQKLLEYAATLPALEEMLEGAGEYLPAPEQSQSLFTRVNELRKSRSAAVSDQPATVNRLSQAFRKLTTRGATKKAAEKGILTALKTGIGGAAALAVTAGVALLQNEKLREYAIAGGTYLVAQTLYALSTIGGLILGTTLGIAGWMVGGPGASLLGTITGANLGVQLAPQQWTSWFGVTPRQPPGFESLFSSQQPIGPEQASMAAMRNTAAINAAATTGGATSAPGLAASSPISASVGTPTAINAGLAGSTGLPSASAATATITNAANALSGWFSGLSLAVVAPMLAVFSMIAITMYVVMVIAGGFIVPTPTRDSNWKGVPDEATPPDPGSEFVELTKTASISKIENNTNTSVTYTVTMQPKGQYSILVRNVTDTFSGYGESSPEIKSLLSAGSFPTEASDQPLELEYTVEFGEGIYDSLITNTIILTFEVYDVNGFVVNRNQTVKTSASVKVGDPKEGCWPTTGTIVQLPYGGFSHRTDAQNPSGIDLDAFDINADIGTPIYAPFPGKLCRRDDGSAAAIARSYGRALDLYININGSDASLIFGHLHTAIIKPGIENCIQVSAGTQIGTTGHTGASWTPHLHYELRSANLSLKDIIIDGNEVVARFNKGERPRVSSCY